MSTTASQTLKTKTSLYLRVLKIASGSLLVSSSVFMAACSSGPVTTDGKPVAKAKLSPKSGSKVKGDLKFIQMDGGVQVVGTVRNLKPKTSHGFHVHEKGDCSSKDAKSAGGHFNPDGHAHGTLGSAHSHAGDLGNVMSDKNGVAQVDAFKKGISLTSGSDLPNVVGKAVVLHGGHDDLKTQPSGHAGPRIGCGVIKQ